ncbi:hypothetical protein BX600DRAFT_493295 [Xylariales sp. PMI_506]|nr:hypothetical protein BX600DRAFT_493295 [Xylariales sp. PMI_506]
MDQFNILPYQPSSGMEYSEQIFQNPPDDTFEVQSPSELELIEELLRQEGVTQPQQHNNSIIAPNPLLGGNYCGLSDSTDTLESNGSAYDNLQRDNLGLLGDRNVTDFTSLTESTTQSEYPDTTSTPSVYDPRLSGSTFGNLDFLDNQATDLSEFDLGFTLPQNKTPHLSDTVSPAEIFGALRTYQPASSRSLATSTSSLIESPSYNGVVSGSNSISMDHLITQSATESLSTSYDAWCSPVPQDGNNPRIEREARKSPSRKQPNYSSSCKSAGVPSRKRLVKKNACAGCKADKACCIREQPGGACKRCLKKGIACEAGGNDKRETNAVREDVLRLLKTTSAILEDWLNISILLQPKLRHVGSADAWNRWKSGDKPADIIRSAKYNCQGKGVIDDMHFKRLDSIYENLGPKRLDARNARKQMKDEADRMLTTLKENVDYIVGLSDQLSSIGVSNYQNDILDFVIHAIIFKELVDGPAKEKVKIHLLALRKSLECFQQLPNPFEIATSMQQMHISHYIHQYLPEFENLKTTTCSSKQQVSRGQPVERVAEQQGTAETRVPSSPWNGMTVDVIEALMSTGFS